MNRLRMLPISALPLPPASHILTRNLTPEHVVPTASSLPRLLRSTPSLLRRSRILPPSVHYAYITPLPISFPYDIPAPTGPVEDGAYSKGEYVEKWLTSHEPLDEVPPAVTGASEYQRHLSKYTSSSRDEKRELLALSSSCLKEWLPLLDVGDAFDQLGEARLSPVQNASSKSVRNGEDATARESIREELVDVLSGQSVLMHLPDETTETESDQAGYAPWSLRYCGHQV
jgi:serine/tyrosine/threonine adenylyltransferase